MKKPRLAIALLCIGLILTGAILKNLIPLSLDWQHDIGQISILVGFIILARIIVPVTFRREK